MGCKYSMSKTAQQLPSRVREPVCPYFVLKRYDHKGMNSLLTTGPCGVMVQASELSVLHPPSPLLVGKRRSGGGACFRFAHSRPLAMAAPRQCLSWAGCALCAPF